MKGDALVDTRALAGADAHFRMQQLCSEYVACLDDDHLEAWPGLFTPACLYKILPRENADRGMDLALMWGDSQGMLVDRVVSMRKANIYAVHYHRHLTSDLRVWTRSDGNLSAQSNFVVFQTRVDGATSIYGAGKYIDVVVEHEGSLRFRSRIAILDTYRIDSLLVRPL